MPTLLATTADRQRLAEAESVLFLVGGYDGSGNYGDVLQLATAIETVRALPGSPLPLAIVEFETRGHHDRLAQRYPDRFKGAAFAFYAEAGGEEEADLVSLTPEHLPTERAALYIYGGGHLNGWWGARKVAHASAAEALAGERRLPVAASGLQVDEPTVSADGPAHDLLSRASWIGLRDIASLEYVRAQLPATAARANLAGDDALPFLGRSQDEVAPVVNLHVNDGTWVGDEPGSIRRAVLTLLQRLGQASGERLELRPLIAYEDPRVSERQVVSGLFEEHQEALEAAGFELAEPLDLLDDAFDNGLANFRRARLTVSCSYHVTLSSLLAGIPAVMLALNEYYAQKAAGLRDLFRLGPSRVGVSGTDGDAPAAIEALVDGDPRTALLRQLHDSSRVVTSRFEQGRVALNSALAQALETAELESRLTAAQLRAESAERQLAAMQATRGWRMLERLRASRDMMR